MLLRPFNYLLRLGFLALACIYVLPSGALAQQGALGPNNDLPLLLSAQQVRDLTLEEAQMGYPVKIRGVITYNDGRWQSLFVQDSTAGIYLYPEARSRGLKVGEMVEIDGYTGGESAPAIREISVKAIGPALMPEAKVVSVDQMMTGKEDGQWVQVEGVVRSLSIAWGRLTVQMVNAGNPFLVHIPDFGGKPLPLDLIDAKLELRGVCGAKLNGQNQNSGLWLFVPGMNHVRVLEPGPKDLFARENRTVKSLLRYNPRTEDGRRVKVSGTVTLTSPSGRLFIRDETGGLQIRMPVMESDRDPQGSYRPRKQMDPVKPGDRIEAVGYPEMGDFSPVLHDAEYRVQGRGEAVRPQSLTAKEIILGRNDAEVVTLKARLIDRQIRRATNSKSDETLIMQDGETIFEALLEDTLPGSVKLQKNSLVQLTGICSVHADLWRQVRSFRLLLRSPEDINVLQKPPLLSFQDALKGLTAIGIFAAGSLTWALALRRRVSQRTAELSASEARYRTMTDHAPEAVVVLDADAGRFIEANENAVSLFGISREQFLELGPGDISPSVQMDGRPSQEQLQAKVQEALEGKTPMYEWMHLKATGNPILTEVRLVRLPSQGRNLVRGSITDITERKRTEAALSERMRTAALTADVALACTRDTSLPIMLQDCCDSFVKHLDVTCAQIWIANERESVLELQASSGTTTRSDKRIIQIDGELSTVGRIAADRKPHWTNDAIGEALVDHQDWIRREQIVAFAGYPLLVDRRLVGVMELFARCPLDEQVYKILDSLAASISVGVVRKLTERALRESEERFSKAFRASPAIVSIARLSDGRFLEVNDSFSQSSGYSWDEVIGKTSEDLGLWTNMEERAAFINEVREKGFVRGREVTFRPKVGPAATLLLSADLIEIENQPCILAVGVDITHKQQAERELLKAVAREKELGELRSSFVSLVSHEFRTPLGIIMSSAEILESYFERLDQESRQEHLHSIQKSTRRMAELMEEVLLLGKMEAGRMGFKPAHLNLDTFFIRVADEVLSATNHRCPISFESQLDQQEGSADEALLRHIFTNLLTNAVKYSQQGSTVHLLVEQQRNSVIVKVRDTGIGIPEGDMDRLFKAFQRARNVGQIPGTGLGLVIVKRCVDLHGGEIKVESEPGKGTTFTVVLNVFGEAVHESEK